MMDYSEVIDNIKTETPDIEDKPEYLDLDDKSILRFALVQHTDFVKIPVEKRIKCEIEKSDMGGTKEINIFNQEKFHIKTETTENFGYEHLYEQNSNTEMIQDDCNGKNEIGDSYMETKNNVHIFKEEIYIKTEDPCENSSTRGNHLNNQKTKPDETKSVKTYTGILYQCNQCLFQAKAKCDIKRHQRSHLSFNDIDTYKCPECSFETKYKNNLKYHKLRHKSINEVDFFKCNQCSYKTKRRQDVIDHQKVHKDPLAPKKYHCEMCIFKSDYKKSLTNHMYKIHKRRYERGRLIKKSSQTSSKSDCQLSNQFSVHENGEYLSFKEISADSDGIKLGISGADVINEEGSLALVATCYPQGKTKMTTLEDTTKKLESENEVISSEAEFGSPSEVRAIITTYTATMLTCPECPYQSKWKHDLKRHLKTHLSVDQVEIYKCSECPFETMYKKNIKEHSLIHKSEDEITMFKCNHCLYHSKRKSDLTAHQKVHRDPMKEKQFKCDQCSFQTNYGRSLKNHSQTHLKSGEQNTYNCKECGFKTVYNSSMYSHALTHKSANDVSMFKCFECSFQTKLKANLTRHQKLHQRQV